MEVAEKWYNVVSERCSDKELLNSFWTEISNNYSSKGRYYHTLDHIRRMLDSYVNWQRKLINEEVVLLAIIYHDIIYDPQKKDNEEQSALYAKTQLSKIGISNDIIADCERLIIATKSHISDGSDRDLNYLLDFDLEILGAKWADYERYTKQIRKEYIMYPDFFYKKGRIKVLQQFLDLKSIYKTDDFINQFEIKARENIRKELKLYLRKS